MDGLLYSQNGEDGLFQSRRHLFILNKYKSHINLDVLVKTKEHGIDMISILAHTSHELIRHILGFSK